MRLPTSNRSRALTAGALLAVVVLVFGVVRACGGSDLEPLPDGEKRPAAVSFGGKPMWDERKLGMTAVAGVELRGDAAVVAGDVGLDGARLAVVDVRTGKPRWVVSTGYPLKGGDGAVAHRDDGYQAEYLRGVTGKPVVYGAGDDWTVLVQYAKGAERRETELGVAALSGKDGSVRWKKALIRPRGDDGDDEQKVRLLAADTRVALTSVEQREGVDPKTIALDPATGRELWENEDGWAFRIAGGVVLGETRGAQAPSAHLWGERRKATDVFALELTSGKKRWDLDAGFESSHLEAAAGGIAAIRVKEALPERRYPSDRTILVDTATGRPTKDSPKAEDDGTSRTRNLYACADDGGTLIACSGMYGRLVTIRPGARGGLAATEKQPFGEDTMAHVDLIWENRIFVTGTFSGRGPARSVVVDRAANRLGPALPGRVVGVSRHAAAFRVKRAGSTSSTPDGLVVHAAAVGAKPSEPAGPGRPTLRPPRIDAAPLWTAGAAGDTGLRSLVSLDLVGDAVAYTGRGRADGNGDKLVVAGAADGKVRWSLSEDGPLGDGARAGFIAVPHFVEAGGEWLALVPYETAGEAEGIAALAMKDGRVRWKKEVSAGDGHISLRAADGKTFAVEVSLYGGPEDRREETVVYDTGTRRELLRKRGVEPAGVGGGLVLTAELGPAGEGAREHRDLIAYRLSDGERRWRLGDRYPEPELLHDEGGKTIVVGTADGGAVLDRATGRELAAIPTPLTRCDGNGDELIVCEAGLDDGRVGRDAGERAVTVQTRGGATTVHDLLETGLLSRYGAAGNWFTAVRPAPREGQGQGDRYLLLDGEGRRISDDLPGRPMEIGGGFAVLSRSPQERRAADPPGFTVHRVRG